MSDAGSPAAASNGAGHPRKASGTSYSHPRSKIARAACFGKSPLDTPSVVRAAAVLPARALVPGRPKLQRMSPNFQSLSRPGTACAPATPASRYPPPLKCYHPLCSSRAWVRTGTSLITFGFSIEQFFRMAKVGVEESKDLIGRLGGTACGHFGESVVYSGADSKIPSKRRIPGDSPIAGENVGLLAFFSVMVRQRSVMRIRTPRV
jgi:hypothetical protein